MKNKELVTFLKDFTYHSKFSFLEMGKDSDELQEIAEKNGVVLPAKDLAVFKCSYAFVERQNKNGCTLPRDEVEKSLATIAHKAIDFDHLRNRVVGHWIDAKLEDDTIYAYGVFLKGNFPDEFEEIRQMMEDSVLAISFEAYGNREFKEDGGYDLLNIEFAGGALLIKTDPAFPGAEVVEMARKGEHKVGSCSERILEYAKVMTEPKEFIKEKTIDKGEVEEKHLEKSKFYIYEIETIDRLIGEVEPPTEADRYYYNILSVDFEKNKAKVQYLDSETVLEVTFTPTSKITKKGKKVKEVSKVEEAKNKIEGKEEEIDMEKKEKIENAESMTDLMGDRERTVRCVDCGYTFKTRELAKSTKCPKCGGRVDLISEGKTQEEEIVEERVKELEESLKTKDAEIASTKEELDQANATIDELKKESEEAKVKIEEIEKAKAEEIEQAKKDAGIVAERKAALGEEYAKDMSEEEILDDVKYENATLKKEVAELKTKKTDATEEPEKAGMEQGSKDKEEEGTDDFSRQKSIQDKAWATE